MTMRTSIVNVGTGFKHRPIDHEHTLPLGHCSLNVPPSTHHLHAVVKLHPASFLSLNGTGAFMALTS